MIPKGIYEARLVEVERKISRAKKTPYTRLEFRTLLPIEYEVEEDETIILRKEPATIHVYLHGHLSHALAWRRLMGQTFVIEMKHRQIDDVVVMDPRLRENVSATTNTPN